MNAEIRKILQVITVGCGVLAGYLSTNGHPDWAVAIGAVSAGISYYLQHVGETK